MRTASVVNGESEMTDFLKRSTAAERCKLRQAKSDGCSPQPVTTLPRCLLDPRPVATIGRLIRPVVHVLLPLQPGAGSSTLRSLSSLGAARGRGRGGGGGRAGRGAADGVARSRRKCALRPPTVCGFTRLVAAHRIDLLSNFGSVRSGSGASRGWRRSRLKSSFANVCCRSGGWREWPSSLTKCCRLCSIMPSWAQLRASEKCTWSSMCVQLRRACRQLRALTWRGARCACDASEGRSRNEGRAERQGKGTSCGGGSNRRGGRRGADSEQD
eukprot:5085641-Pleurochrysis_carterae.AAC.3